MFDFIPITQYTEIYYHTFFLVMCLLLLHSYIYEINDKSVVSFSSNFGFFFFIIFTFYLGSRPVSYLFGDMYSYAKVYKNLEDGGDLIITKDYIFNYFMILCSKIMDEKSFFFSCALLYIIPYYIFSKKYFKDYWFFAFFMMAGSFMFWPFGTNGIRNGIATSLFIFALCYYENKIFMYGLMILSFGFHYSLLIPITSFLVASLNKNSKVYLYIWIAAIPLSLIGGGFWEAFFSNLGFGDNRAENYLDPNMIEKLEKNEKTTFAYIGFRWDFLFYSTFAVFAGWYFIFKKRVTDRFYIHLWGTYMIANAFWILVIRAAFSNRFAYLSWFLMAIIIAYPLFRYKIFKDQYKIAGVIMMIYYMFTYLLFLKG